MPMWTQNWRDTVELFGLEWDDDEFLYKHAGKSLPDTLKLICKAQGKEVPCLAMAPNTEGCSFLISFMLEHVRPTSLHYCPFCR